MSMTTHPHGSMVTTVKALNEMGFIPGLTEDEVRTRREHGQGNDLRLATSRPLGDILRQNVFTPINLVLFGLGAAMVSIGRISEALVSVSIISMNIVVGIYQEVRAKRKLDRIALLTRPKVNVMRDGAEIVVDPGEIVRGDVLVLRPGDQVVVDGILVGEGRIEVDESLLTGESDPIPKSQGDSVLSGSFCVTGTAKYVARRVGEKSFANQLAAEARSFRVVRTPLQHDVDFVIRVLMLVAMIFGLLLGVSAVLSDIPLMRGVQAATVIAGLVPNGLFFMVIVAYAMGALRIASRGALIQQSNSVESLSNVNVLCMDKTGTLTANSIRYHALTPIDADVKDLEHLLGDFAASASVTNRTSAAIVEALGGQARRVVDEVPFSSARKWSALALSDKQMRGVYVLGAWEMLRPYFKREVDVSAQMDAWTQAGLRVLVFAYNSVTSSLHDETRSPTLPPLVPLGLIAFSDVLRPEAFETLAGFKRAGISLKVISGDHVQTVAALARQAGLDGDLKLISGPELEELDKVQFEQVAEEVTVFGRIRPEQKEKLVDALRARGHYVAMIGDGVNDVLSLKKANLGIAMQSGSGATRSVADMVLLNDSFSALPPAFLEGQRINSGMRDILRLYMARAVQLVLVILAVAFVGMGFPYIPKHIQLVALLTIGIPTFALAVWARPEKADQNNLLLSVVHFAFPAGISSFIFCLLLYAYTFNSLVNQGRTIDVLHQDIASFQTYAGIDYSIYTQDEFVYEVAVLYSQTVLTTFSVITSLLLVLFVEPPVRWFVGGDRYSGDWRPTLLAAGMMGIFVLIMAVPSFRRFWELLPLEWSDWLIVLGAAAVWTVVQRFIWRANLFERFLHLDFIDHVSTEEWN